MDDQFKVVGADMSSRNTKPATWSGTKILSQDVPSDKSHLPSDAPKDENPQPPAQFGNIPLELQQSIVDFVATPDLLSLRLCSTACAELSQKYMFRDLRLALTQRSVDRVTFVARHPIFRKNVRTFVVEIAPIPIRLNFGGFTTAIRGFLQFGVFEDPQLQAIKEFAQTLNEIPEDYTRSYACWKKLLLLQRQASNLRKKGVLQQILTKTLRHFPRLESIGTSTKPGMIGEYLPTGLPPQFQWNDERSSIRLVLALFRAVRDNKIRPDYLHIQAIHADFFSRYDAKTLMDPTSTRCESLAFASVKSVEFSLLFRDFADIFTERMNNGLRLWLENMPQIESLCISSHRPTGPLKLNDFPRLSMKVFRGGQPWLYLRKVEIAKFSATSDEIVGLVQDHAATLRSLILEYIWLTHGTWQDVFDGLAIVSQLREFRADSWLYQVEDCLEIKAHGRVVVREDPGLGKVQCFSDALQALLISSREERETLRSRIGEYLRNLPRPGQEIPEEHLVWDRWQCQHKHKLEEWRSVIYVV